MPELLETIVDYENPPVAEVVCGVLFKPIEAFLVPHFGLLWQKYIEKYPNCREIIPIAHIVEPLETRAAMPESQEMQVFPPRIWFLDKNENSLIQVQKDRFLYNWKEVKKGDKYPHFEQIYGAFHDEFSILDTFIKERKLGTIEPQQFELTYVNHIIQGSAWESYGSISKLFPDFAWRQNTRFLPDIETINWRTTFLLPERGGRLTVTARSGFRREDQHPVILLDLTVRGFSENRLSGLKDWFALAHKWIVKGFADLTSQEVQTDVWRRIK